MAAHGRTYSALGGTGDVGPPGWGTKVEMRGRPGDLAWNIGPRARVFVLRR
jgi:hypothetical protein